MKMALECVPCMVQQAVEAARYYSDDPAQQWALVHEVTAAIPDLDPRISMPEVVGMIYQRIRQRFGDHDFYKEVKDRSNRKALDLYPMLKQKVNQAPDPLLAAVEIAVIGNVIDYAAKNHLDIEAQIEQLFAGELPEINHAVFDYESFRSDLLAARRILILGDNTGEIVFDKVLIESLPEGKEVFYAVRGRPILNDATLDDAEFCGLHEVAAVISSGVMSPGTVLSQCSPEFLDVFQNADLIISKGQGNYEALFGTAGPIYFLFKIKCKIIARHAGGALSDMMLVKA